MQGIKKLLSCCLLSLLFLSSLSAQDSANWKGTPFGEFRSFYLATWNKEELKDFMALAVGGKLGYRQAMGKHLSLQAVGYLSVNTQLQDLGEPDLITGKGSRYEIGLFSMPDPDRAAILLLGEAYADVNIGRHNFRLGRQKIVSPFFNPQDGRMIPTLAEGLWYRYESPKAGAWSLAGIHRIAPRSTHRFYGIGESIGQYPTGRNHDGTPAGYAGNTISDFLLLANWQHRVGNVVDVSLWEYYADNVFNLVYGKGSVKLGDKGPEVGLEFAQQNRVGQGGNKTDSLRYYADKSARVVGLQLKQGNRHQFSLGYNRIFNGGRFLFPREWGREFLFTFQKRERSEGLANAHSLLLSYYWLPNKGKGPVKIIAGLGQHWTAEVSQPEDNKYALPDYTHFNVDLFYTPAFLKRLQAELLFVYKKASSASLPDNPALYLNKVDMVQLNVVLNYRF